MFVLDNLCELLDGSFLHGIAFKQRADTVRDLLVAGGDGSSCHEKKICLLRREDVSDKKMKNCRSGRVVAAIFAKHKNKLKRNSKYIFVLIFTPHTGDTVHDSLDLDPSQNPLKENGLP